MVVLLVGATWVVPTPVAALGGGLCEAATVPYDPLIQHVGKSTTVTIANSAQVTASHTVPAGKVGAFLGVMVHYLGPTNIQPLPDIETVTYDGVALELIADASDEIVLPQQSVVLTSELWGLADGYPLGTSALATGSNDLIVTWSSQVLTSVISAHNLCNVNLEVPVGDIAQAGGQSTEAAVPDGADADDNMVTTEDFSSIFGGVTIKSTATNAQLHLQNEGSGATDAEEHDIGATNTPGTSVVEDLQYATAIRNTTAPANYGFGWDITDAGGLATIRDWTLAAVELRTRPVVEFTGASDSDWEHETSQSFQVQLSQPYSSFLVVEYAAGGPTPVYCNTPVEGDPPKDGTTDTACPEAVDYLLDTNIYPESFPAGCPKASSPEPKPRALCFEPGDTTEDLPITLTDDAFDEDDETFTVHLVEPAQPTVYTPLFDGPAPSFTFTILDNDVFACISSSSPASNAESTDTKTYTVTLTEPWSLWTIKVPYEFTVGTAEPGEDFDDTPGDVLFAPGETSKDLDVTIYDEAIFETDESFTVELQDPEPVPLTLPDNAHLRESDPSCASTSTYTILNDDAPPNVSFQSSASSGGEAISPATVDVVLLDPNTGAPTVTGFPFSLSVNAADGTAGGSDYAFLGPTLLVFEEGQGGPKQVQASIVNDIIDEPSETFTMTLSNVQPPAVASIQPFSVHTRTILDDDDPPFVRFDLASGSAAEPAADDARNIRVILTSTPSGTTPKASGYTLDVPYAISGGTAGASDYTLESHPSTASQVLRFDPGVTELFVPVTIHPDDLVEDDETLTIQLDAADPNVEAGSILAHTHTILDEDQATLELVDACAADPAIACVAEGQPGDNHQLEFRIRITKPVSNAVSVDFATQDCGCAQQATVANDYGATSGTVTFTAAEMAGGTLEKPFFVPVTADAVQEPDEFVGVQLSNLDPGVATVPPPVTLGTSQGVGRIVNDDGPPVVSISDVTLVEGHVGTKTATFQVTLSNPTTTLVTMDFATADDAPLAAAGIDYDSTSGALSFSPGQTTKQVAVTIHGDISDEPDERFRVELSNVQGAALGGHDLTGIGTITDDDGPPSLSIDDVQVVEGPSGSTTALQFLISVSTPSGFSISVAYASAPGPAPAVDGDDHTPVSGTAVIPPGQSSWPLLVPVHGDALHEADEHLTLTLSSPQKATITDDTGIGTILDDDAAPNVSIRDASVLEGDGPGTTLDFLVELDAPSGLPVVVGVRTHDGTATSPADFAATQATLSIQAGATSATFVVPVAGDTIDEPDSEQLTATIESATGATIADPNAIGTIFDNDPPPSLVVEDRPPVTEPDPPQTTAMPFTVRLLSSSNQQVEVDVQAIAGTAGPLDFDSVPAHLVFLPGGPLVQTFLVDVKGDLIDEPSETFTVRLSNPTNVAITKAESIGTIEDNDLPPTVHVDDTSGQEGTGANAPLSFRVHLVGATAKTTSVQYATQDGTASAPADYADTQGSLVFAPGEVEKSVEVPVVGDPTDEPDETMRLVLSGLVDLRPGDLEATGTILDDDAPPRVVLSAPTVTEGDSGATPGTFTWTLERPSGKPVHIDWSTGPSGTGPHATPGSDFTASSGTLIIPAGAPSGTSVVDVLGDLLDEPDERFRVSGVITTEAPPPGSVLGAAATIEDDDGPPAVLVDDATAVEGDAVMTFSVRVQHASGQDVSVTVRTPGSGPLPTATLDDDYQHVEQTVVIPAGSLAVPVAVPVVDDGLHEADERFHLSIVPAPDQVVAKGTAIGTILDDDGAPPLTISVDPRLEEDDGASPEQRFTATLDFATGRDTLIDWTTLLGGAQPAQASDFQSASGSVTIPAGSTTATWHVRLVGDDEDEPDETYLLRVTSVVGAVAPPDTAATIVDDDVPGVRVRPASGLEAGGPLVFEVTIDRPPYTSVSVQAATADGTALAGSDYTTTTTTVTWAAGDSSTKTVQVPVLDDVIQEAGAETFTVGLDQASGVVLLDASATGTIFDDDGPPTVNVADVAVLEGDSGTTAMTFEVRLVPASGSTVSVPVSFPPGTATSNVDHVTPAPFTLHFSPGDTKKDVVVTVNGDTTDEPDETLFIELATPPNAQAGQMIAQGVIEDDDGPPRVTLFGAGSPLAEDPPAAGQVTAQLSEVSAFDVTVHLFWSGTAKPGVDVFVPATLSIPAGSLVASGPVQVLPDDLDEPDETLLAAIDAVDNGVEDGIQEASWTILDGDDPPTITLTADPLSIAETGGIAQLAAILSAPSAKTVRANLQYTGQAVDGVDYTATRHHVEFPPGITQVGFAIHAKHDTLHELDEHAVVTLADLQETTPGSVTSRTVTIVDDDAAPSVTLALADSPLVEDGGVAVVTGTLSKAAGTTVSVGLLVAGSAVAADRVISTMTLTFPPGSTEASLTITGLDDVLDEDDETVIIALGALQHALPGTVTEVTATIIDDDDPPALTLELDGSPAAEGGSARIRAHIDRPSGRSVEAALSWSGTATMSDLDRITGPLVITPGETRSVWHVVQVHDDTEDEPTEEARVTATAAAALGAPTATLAILDDDVVGISVLDAPAVPEDGGAPLAFTIVLDRPSFAVLEVDVETRDVQARSPEDYHAVQTKVMVPAGAQSADVLIHPKADVFFETDEALALDITGAASAGGHVVLDAVALGTIENDDDRPFLHVDATEVVEGDSGTTLLVVPVRLVPGTLSPVTAEVFVEPGTALLEADLLDPGTRSVRFEPGTTVQPIFISILGDRIDEDDETFTVRLADVSANAQGGAMEALATILDDEEALLELEHVAVLEGDDPEATTAAPVRARLTHVRDRPFMTDGTTADGTATAPADYDEHAFAITIPAGSSQVVIGTDTRGDLIEEGDETYDVLATGASAGSVTIFDNEGPPGFLVRDASPIGEGAGGTTSIARLEVVLQPPSAQQTIVDFKTMDGSAKAGEDYIARSGTLVFPAGATSRFVDVTVIGDEVDEADETFALLLEAPKGAWLRRDTGIATIQDDEDAVFHFQVEEESAVVEGDTGTRFARFHVGLDKPADRVVSVSYGTFPIDASAADYADVAGTLTFPVGAQGPFVVEVPVFGDTIDEPDETFIFFLHDAVGALISGSGQSRGLILDDEGPPRLSVFDASMVEGDGPGQLSFHVRLVPSASHPVSVDWTAAPATADSADFTPGTARITFPPGVDTVAVAIPVHGDLVDEAAVERFWFTIHGAIGADIQQDRESAWGHIIDDDESAAAVFDITVDEKDVGTTMVDVAVHLSLARDRPTLVRYVTGPGSAEAADYDDVEGVLTIPAGSKVAVVPVGIHGDLFDEPDEEFFFYLQGAGEVPLAQDTARIRIIDDDGLPTLFVADTSVSEGDVGWRDVAVTVRLEPPSGRTVRVQYELRSGNAQAGADFAPAQGELVFLAGQDEKTIVVQVRGDFIDESNELLYVDLHSPQAAILGTSTGSLLIIDDDDVVTNLVATAGRNFPEGHEGVRPVRFEVELSNPGGEAVRVSYWTVDHEAKAGEDYVQAAGVLTIPAGVKTADVEVLIIGDRKDEPDERFVIYFEDPVNAQLATTYVVGVIMDDDGPQAPPDLPTASDPLPTYEPPTVRLLGRVVEVEEGEPAILEVVRSDVAGALAVHYGLEHETASPADHGTLTGVVHLAPGQGSALVVVAALEDDEDEGSEAFSLVLRDDPAYHLGTPHVARILILDGVAVLAPPTPLPPVVHDLTGAGTVRHSGGSPLLVWSPATDAVGYQVWRLEEDWVLVGETEETRLAVPPGTYKITFYTTPTAAGGRVTSGPATPGWDEGDTLIAPQALADPPERPPLEPPPGVDVAWVLWLNVGLLLVVLALIVVLIVRRPRP